ncbi:MAG: hypothetical protein Q7K44_01920 [Candidatus Liptonbacteria bacterium]|nr:hypothetical protein [Candidatus Liptonbacteria bacterium]
MVTAIYEKLKMEIKQELFKELSELVLRDSKDHEGEYQHNFVKKIIRIAGKKDDCKKYDRKEFLKVIS